MPTHPAPRPARGLALKWAIADTPGGLCGAICGGRVRFIQWCLKTKAGQFAFFFVMEAICFFIIVANTRAFTQGSYFWTSITDTLFSAQSFAVGKLMIDDPRARTWAAGLGNTAGGTCGSLIAIWVTKHLYGA